jgi:hypothetical protein
MVQEAASCSSGSMRARAAAPSRCRRKPSDSRAERAARSFRRGSAPSEKKAFSVVPEAARAANRASSGSSGAEVEDHVPDRHPAARRPAARRREDAERQVLDGEVRVAVGALHPAPQRGVVRGVHAQRVPRKPFGMPSQQWS